MTLQLYAGDPEGRMHSGNPTVFAEVEDGKFFELRAMMINKWGNETDVSFRVYIDDKLYTMRTPVRIGIIEKED